MAARKAQIRVCVGAIAGALGLKGEVRIKPFTETPEDVAAYGPVETEDGAHRFTLEVTRRLKGGLVAARLASVTGRAAAEALKGVRLYVPRSALPAPTEPDDYYCADLVGLTVIDMAGREIGQVQGVQDFGAGDLLEVRLAGNGQEARNTIFLPFTQDVVPEVDLPAGSLMVDPPDGLLPEAEE